jgi:methylmalonyl-CoA mutase N-terminal domain/subunit
LIQRKLSESASGRKADIANGKEILLGTNRFPDFNEKAHSNIDLTRVFKLPVVESDHQIEPIKLFRGSEENERLRLGADKVVKM